MFSLIAIDTSNKYYSIYAKINDHEYFIDSDQEWRHAEEILPKINEIFDFTQNTLDRFIVNIGPGSFTGLRIGISIAKAFSIASPKTKIIPISTYEIVRNATGKDNVIIDAGRGEFALAEFDPQGKILLTQILTEGDLNLYSTPYAIISDRIENADIKRISAQHLSKENKYYNYQEVTPLYFRPPDAVPCK